jgi:hypothetical protein
MECNICCEEMNNGKRKSIQCPNHKCSLNVCKICVKTYLEQNADKPHCMGCKTSWDRKFQIDNIGKSWIEGAYKKHRKNILFDIEKARLPETMPFIEAKKSIDKKKEELNKQKLTIANLRRLLDRARGEEYILKRDIHTIEHGGVVEKNTKKFIRACPHNECNGFLSTQWKCGICDIYVCKDCFEIIGEEKNMQHVCDEDTKKTADLMKKETKNCPCCAVAIFKISGCDQMWCTQCQVAFSWKTGMKVTGIVHNPHFYEAQRNGLITNVQNPGAVACGGIPRIYDFNRKLKSLLEPFRKQKKRPDGTRYDSMILKTAADLLYHFNKMHRGAIHFQHVIIDPLRQKVQQLTDNKDLRMRYILKQIDEKHMKMMIAKRDKAHEKHIQQLQIYELLNTILTERMVYMYNNIDLKNMVDGMNEIERARIYCNGLLCKISCIYGNKIKLIKDNFYTISTYGYKKSETATTFVIPCISSEIEWHNMVDERGRNLRY